MLSAKMAKIILTVYPDLKELKRKYAAKMKKLRSFDYNALGHDAESVFGDYIVTAVTFDALKRFHTTVNAALDLLTEQEKSVIKAEFFDGLERENIIKLLNVNKSGLKYLRTKALKKVQVYVEMLGFTEDDILEYFNEDPYFIEAAEEIEARYEVAKRFLKA